MACTYYQEDLEFMLRATACGAEAVVVQEPLFHYHVAQTSLTGSSHRKGEALRTLFDVLAAADPECGHEWALGLLSSADYAEIIFGKALRAVPVALANGDAETASSLLMRASEILASHRSRGRTSILRALMTALHCTERVGLSHLWPRLNHLRIQAKWKANTQKCKCPAAGR